MTNFGVLGRKRSGKSTVAECLREQYGYTVLGFADPLRELARRVNPIIDNDGKNDPVHYAPAEKWHGYERMKDMWPESRIFLQDLGNGVREVFGDRTFINELEHRLGYVEGSVVVPDVRYPNEVESLIRHGFWTVRVERPGLDDSDTHISETALDGYYADFLIKNTGSLQDLKQQVDELVRTTTITTLPN